MYLVEVSTQLSKAHIAKLYKWLEMTGLISKTYIVHNIENQYTGLKNEFPCHFNKLDLEKIKDFEEEDIIDLLVDVGLDKASLIVSTLNVDEEFKQKFYEVAKVMEINYKVIGYDSLGSVNFTVADDRMNFVIMEILQDRRFYDYEVPKYGFKDFMYKFKIDKDGIIYNNKGNRVGSMPRSDLNNVFIKMDKETINYVIETNRKIEKIENELGLSICLEAPWYFLEFNTDVIDDIIRYKKIVFDLLKNISEKEFFRMNSELQQILMDNRFINLDYIGSIENKTHELFETDWFVEIILQS